jgi:hypothetical protein
MQVINLLFGEGVKTSIGGYIVAALVAILPLMQGNTWTWRDLIVPAIVAIASRFTKINPDIGKKEV